VSAAKTKHASPVPVEQIGRSILVLRGHRVLLDAELARIYGVETRVLNSSRAVEMSIYVVRAFVQLREFISSNKDLARRLDQLEARIEKKLLTHDDAIAAMLSAIRQLMNPPLPKRRPIGFTADLTEKS
jgi:hypothetical protein